jgi:hypothetical protein
LVILYVATVAGTRTSTVTVSKPPTATVSKAKLPSLPGWAGSRIRLIKLGSARIPPRQIAACGPGIWLAPPRIE